MRAVVAQAVKGGDFCDLFFEDTRYTSLTLRDGAVSSGGFHRDYGCGVRVLCGEKTGYAYTESVDYNSLLTAARAAGSICAAASPVGPFKACGMTPGVYYSQQKDWGLCSPSEFTGVLLSLDDKIRKGDSRVTAVIAQFSYSLSEIMIYNSLDELSSDLRPMASLAVSVVFRKGDRIENKSVSRSFMCGAEFVSGNLVAEMASDALKGVDAMFEASQPKGGNMSVVMGAGASGILLHEAMGHAFEADFNRKGQSVFSDRMGSRVCKRGLNIVDDATLPSARGSLNVDDEGVPGQKTYMVTDGVLTSYLHDRISARYYSVAPTGNGRRESFRYEPLPRMRNTYMENGSDGTVEDLIGSVGRGIFVDEFANGQVKIGEGDFTFYVKSGFLIENGRLTRPVKDVNIIGNGPQALSDIRAVASDLAVSPGAWVCGKGQSVPVSCGIPSVLIGNLTVGGR